MCVCVDPWPDGQKMLLKLSDLDPNGLWLDEEIELPPVPWVGGEELRCERVTVRGRLVPASDGIDFEARFATRVHIHCMRCLAEVCRPLEGGFRLRLVPGPCPAEGSEEMDRQTSPEEVDLLEVANDEVDLVALLREQLDLAMPARVLCSTECKGLCSCCGSNLNDAACGCAREQDDPGGGLAQLRRILEQRQGSEPSGRN